MERSGLSRPVLGSKCSVSWLTVSPASSSAVWRSISALMPCITKRNEFMFLSSVFVPSSSEPLGRMETLASQRSDPSSMFTSETPSWRSVTRSSVSHSRASSAERRSGSETISASGVPARLKSTTLADEPWMRPDSPRWISFAASSSRWIRCSRTSPT